MLKWFFDISTGFRFQRSVWECSVHICSCPCIIIQIWSNVVHYDDRFIHFYTILSEESQKYQNVIFSYFNTAVNKFLSVMPLLGPWKSSSQSKTCKIKCYTVQTYNKIQARSVHERSCIFDIRPKPKFSFKKNRFKLQVRSFVNFALGTPSAALIVKWRASNIIS